MTTSTRTKSIIAIFVAAIVAPVGPAAASVVEPVSQGSYSSSDTSGPASSVTALSHDSASTAASSNELVTTASVTALSHDSGSPAAQGNEPVATASVSGNRYSVNPSTGAATALAHNSGDSIQLRRDGSKATPFVDLGSEPIAATSDGFDWGAAAIGAGVGLLAACLAAFGAAAVSDRRSDPSRSTTAASQSA
jgi:hypothetical protein